MWRLCPTSVIFTIYLYIYLHTLPTYVVIVAVFTFVSIQKLGHSAYFLTFALE